MARNLANTCQVMHTVVVGLNQIACLPVPSGRSLREGASCWAGWLCYACVGNPTQSLYIDVRPGGAAALEGFSTCAGICALVRAACHDASNKCGVHLNGVGTTADSA